MRKQAIVALISTVFLAALPIVAVGQLNPKSQEYRILEEKTRERTLEATKEQKAYDELFGDCNEYLRQAVLNTQKANEHGVLSASSTQIFSLRGLLNLEIYKMCRELKGGK